VMAVKYQPERWPNPDFGSFTGHSLCSSYTYTVVTKALYNAVRVLDGR
jgi:hypothetical protein